MLKSYTVAEHACEKLAYTVAEAAQAVGVSRPTMTAWVNTSGFPAFRSGKRWVIPVSALECWLNEQASKGGNVAG